MKDVKGVKDVKTHSVALVIVALAGTVTEAVAQQSKYPFNERPAEATVTLSTTSRGRYDGTYKLTDVARVCGEMPKDLNFAVRPDRQPAGMTDRALRAVPASPYDRRGLAPYLCHDDATGRAVRTGRVDHLRL